MRSEVGDWGIDAEVTRWDVERRRVARDRSLMVSDAVAEVAE